MTKLYQYLLDAAAEEPNRIFIEFDEITFPFSLVADQAKQVTAALRELGVKPGDTIGLMLPNIPQFVTVYYGALMNGCVVVPINVMLRGSEIQYLAEDSNLRIIVTYEMFVEQVEIGIKSLENPPQVFVVGQNIGPFRPFQELMKPAEGLEPTVVDDELPIMTLYTSGTTGKPKGAQITNANVIANLDMFEAVIPHEGNDKWLCVLPLFHCFALNGILNASVRLRSAVVLHPRFDLDACMKSLMEDDITSFAGVPTMYFYLLKHPKIKEAKFPRLRYAISGGAALPVDVLKGFEKTTGVPIYEGFGMTETTVSVSMNRPEARKIGSIGQPFEGVDMRIFDEDDKEVPVGEVGELVIRAPNLLCGYLNQPEATAESMRSGWFHTGDLSYRDEDNFFYIVDRKKDMIIKGGFNIYPREIEEVIYQIPEVAEAAVVGAFDEAKGEHIVAVVAPKPGKELTVGMIATHLEANLAKYKLPQEYVLQDELPKGPTGKILKREIRDSYDQWNRDRIKADDASQPVAGG